MAELSILPQVEGEDLFKSHRFLVHLGLEDGDSEEKYTNSLYGLVSGPITPEIVTGRQRVVRALLENRDLADEVERIDLPEPNATSFLDRAAYLHTLCAAFSLLQTGLPVDASSPFVPLKTSIDTAVERDRVVDLRKILTEMERPREYQLELTFGVDHADKITHWRARSGTVGTPTTCLDLAKSNEPGQYHIPALLKAIHEKITHAHPITKGKIDGEVNVVLRFNHDNIYNSFHDRTHIPFEVALNYNNGKFMQSRCALEDDKLKLTPRNNINADVRTALQYAAAKPHQYKKGAEIKEFYSKLQRFDGVWRELQFVYAFGRSRSEESYIYPTITNNGRTTLEGITGQSGDTGNISVTDVEGGVSITVTGVDNVTGGKDSNEMHIIKAYNALLVPVIAGFPIAAKSATINLGHNHHCLFEPANVAPAEYTPSAPAPKQTTSGIIAPQPKHL